MSVSPSVEIVTLTPDMATKFLNTNTRNRTVNKGRVLSYSEAIRRGEWELTPDGGIGFDAEGVMIDGQHRCLAVVKANKPIPVVVYRGLKASAQDKTNTGQTRSLAGQLSIRGEKDSSHLAAVITIAHAWEHGLRGIALRSSSGATSAGLSQSITSLMAYFDANRDAIVHAATIGRRIADSVPIGGRAAGLIAWVLPQIDHDDADAFIASMIDGADLGKNDPIYVLRNRLFEMKRQVTTAHSLSGDVTLALTFKAWNAWRNGDEISILRYKVGGAKKESFPEPK